MLYLFTNDYIYRAITGQIRNIIPANKISFPISMLIIIIQLLIMALYTTMWTLTKIPIINTIIESICINFTRGRIGFLLRGIYFKTQLKKMGSNVFIDKGATIIDPQYVEIGANTFIDTNVEIYGGTCEETLVKIGEYVHIAHDVILAGRAGIVIGNYTGIAASARIYSSTHHYKRENLDSFVIISPLVPIQFQSLINAPITIKNHVFVGFNSIIFPGVTLNEGCVIGALSIVKSNIAAFDVVAGNPLKIINKRPSKDMEIIL